jgi:hypothetical protein
MPNLWRWLVYGPADQYTREGWLPWGGAIGAGVLLAAFVAWAWWSGR